VFVKTDRQIHNSSNNDSESTKNKGNVNVRLVMYEMIKYLWHLLHATNTSTAAADAVCINSH
jgi:hypothetical protein